MNKWTDRFIERQTMPAGELAKRYNRKNYRLHPDLQRDAVEGSLDALGWVGQVKIANDGRIFDGHLRVELALVNGENTPVPVDVYDLTEAETDKALLLHDTTTGMAEIDIPKLGELWQAVDLDNPAIDAHFAQEFDFNVNGNDPSGAPKPQIDRAAELQKKWGTELGQLWQLGDHRLICGDCTDATVVERVMGGELAQLVITDPPYGVSYADKNKWLNSISPGNRIQTEIKNDHASKDETQAMWKSAFKEMVGAMQPGAAVYCFMPQGGDQMMMMMMMMMMSAGIEPRHEIIWLKNNHVLGRVDYAYKHEPILYAWKEGGHKFYGGFQTSVIEFPKPQSSDLHPTMKPVGLVEKLLTNSSLKDATVYDPFLGSGTTLIACENLNRKCRASEIDPGYVAVTLERWAEHTGKTPELITD